MSNTHIAHSRKKCICMVASSYSIVTDLHNFKLSDPSRKLEPCITQTCQYFSAGICFWKSFLDCLILPKTMKELWIPVVVSAFVFFMVPWGSLNLIGSSRQGKTALLVPGAFLLQRFKEQLSHLLSSCCLLPLDPKFTRLIPLGAEDPSKLPHDLLLFLLLCNNWNFTWAILFACTQRLSSLGDESEESQSSVHLGLEIWNWK